MVPGGTHGDAALLRPQLRGRARRPIAGQGDRRMGRDIPRRGAAGTGPGIPVPSRTLGRPGTRSAFAEPLGPGSSPVSWPRVIVCLDVANGRVVKGTRFKDLKDV